MPGWGCHRLVGIRASRIQFGSTNWVGSEKGRDSVSTYNRNNISAYILLPAGFLDSHYPGKPGGRNLPFLDGPHNTVYQHGRTPKQKGPSSQGPSSICQIFLNQRAVIQTIPERAVSEMLNYQTGPVCVSRIARRDMWQPSRWQNSGAQGPHSGVLLANHEV